MSWPISSWDFQQHPPLSAFGFKAASVQGRLHKRLQKEERSPGRKKVEAPGASSPSPSSSSPSPSRRAVTLRSRMENSICGLPVNNSCVVCVAVCLILFAVTTVVSQLSTRNKESFMAPFSQINSLLSPSSCSSSSNYFSFFNIFTTTLPPHSPSRIC